MNEMTRRVAYAIAEAEDSFMGKPIDYEEVAEKAILALRHPSDDMLEVVAELPQQHNRLDMWCAMIDVALGRLVKVEEDEIS